jgi:hypothetical protein
VLNPNHETGKKLPLFPLTFYPDFKPSNKNGLLKKDALDQFDAVLNNPLIAGTMAAYLFNHNLQALQDDTYGKVEKKFEKHAGLNPFEFNRLMGFYND